MEFIQLTLVNGGRCIQHHVPAAVVFRERNKVANGFTAANYCTQPVEAKSDAAMRRCSVFEGPKQKSEFVLLFFFVHAKGSKHFFLQLSLEDSD